VSLFDGVALPATALGSVWVALAMFGGVIAVRHSRVVTEVVSPAEDRA